MNIFGPLRLALLCRVELRIKPIAGLYKMVVDNIGRTAEIAEPL